ncbi:hypothetical protein LL998_06605 [Burkholderia ambifaria]|uniref:hypothetical protein n=1 Tax=Burkholderia ambifaria TaxID=152480 RepID=UPI001E57A035|nr:hypothetical protein [Burkholderia ambifaria]UEP35955.1 hypothetical protein LL998_06605 [Burkholderia ambifaria]
MKNARPSKAESSAKRQSEFTGTANPRQLRALTMLQRRPMPREELDGYAGCSNGPDLIAGLRAKGLALPCVRVACIDRDGIEVQRGVYHLTTSDRRKVARWLRMRAEGGVR